MPNDFFSLNEDLQLRVLGFTIRNLNKLDYPPRSKKIFTALKYLNSPKEIKHQLGGCLLTNRNKYIFIENFPSSNEKINQYLMTNKDELINRKIKKFSNKN